MKEMEQTVTFDYVSMILFISIMLVSPWLAAVDVVITVCIFFSTFSISSSPEDMMTRRTAYVGRWAVV